MLKSRKNLSGECALLGCVSHESSADIRKIAEHFADN
jgi:hypothetical protein